MRIKTVVKRKKAKKRSKLVPRYEIRSDVEKIARDEFFGEERNAYKSKSVVHKKRNRPAVIDSSQISGKSDLRESKNGSDAIEKLREEDTVTEEVELQNDEINLPELREKFDFGAKKNGSFLRRSSKPYKLSGEVLSVPLASKKKIFIEANSNPAGSLKLSNTNMRNTVGTIDMSGNKLSKSVIYKFHKRGHKKNVSIALERKEPLVNSHVIPMPVNRKFLEDSQVFDRKVLTPAKTEELRVEGKPLAPRVSDLKENASPRLKRSHTSEPDLSSGVSLKVSEAVPNVETKERKELSQEVVEEEVLERKESEVSSHGPEVAKILQQNKLHKAMDIILQRKIIEGTPESVMELLLFHRKSIDNVAFVDYITSQENAHLIDSFLEREINYEQLDLDIALRRTIYLFKTLPVEGQRIGRIIKSLGKRYFKDNPSAGFQSSEAVASLANSILMLNPLIHLKKGHRKMMPEFTLQDWVENNTSKNAGSDYDKQILEDIYVNIRDDEIKLLGDEKHPAAIKKGWLMVFDLTATFRSWKKRWCVIEDNTFFEMKRSSDAKSLGEYPLENASIQTSNEEGENCVEISLTLPRKDGTTKKVLRLYKALDPKNNERWLNCLKISKSLSEKGSAYIEKLQEQKNHDPPHLVIN